MRFLVLRPSPEDAVAIAFEAERNRREGTGSLQPSPTLDVREVVDQRPVRPQERTVCYATAARASAIARALNYAEYIETGKTT